MATAPPVPDLPPIVPFRSTQYEFTDEQNRQILGLVDAMRVSAGLMQVLGLALVVFCTLVSLGAVPSGGSYTAAIALGAAAFVCLCIGFWTGSAANSFRKIVETKNEDIWHLMNALGQLHNMYALLRILVLGSLVLAAIGFAVSLATSFGK
jgi:hypothetical protein